MCQEDPSPEQMTEPLKHLYTSTRLHSNHQSPLWVSEISVDSAVLPIFNSHNERRHVYETALKITSF
jgi:hypothetical protein